MSYIWLICEICNFVLFTFLQPDLFFLSVYYQKIKANLMFFTSLQHNLMYQDIAIRNSS